MKIITRGAFIENKLSTTIYNPSETYSIVSEKTGPESWKTSIYFEKKNMVLQLIPKQIIYQIFMVMMNL